ncbi:MAG: MliC family protein [Spirochaetaceae bacterium]|nr:MliC family protein [Spirochaetaceae bacterium]
MKITDTQSKRLFRLGLPHAGAAVIFTIFFALLIGMTACSNQDKGKLTVTGGDPVDYQAENGDRLVAKYYSLSDKSLDFVKVTLPDGMEYTLPRVLSASGVRYTDDMELVWWTKGDTAHAERRDANGEWQTLYAECREIEKGK